MNPPLEPSARPVEHLDLATAIKVSQAVSGEIVLEKLIDRLMRIAIEQEAGTITAVRVGGNCCFVGEGDLEIP